jgi:hypothetical protein
LVQHVELCFSDNAEAWVLFVVGGWINSDHIVPAILYQGTNIPRKICGVLDKSQELPKAVPGLLSRAGGVFLTILIHRAFQHRRHGCSGASFSGRYHLIGAAEETMTIQASPSGTHVACHANDNFAVERDRPPVPLWFAVTVVVMNVLSAVLTLMAWAAS